MAYNRDRAPKEDNGPEMIEKVVYLNRVSKTVKGGRVMKFSALVVVGDGKGTVGYGLGKAAEVSEAILKGIADAKKNMVKITLPKVPASSPAALSVLSWKQSAFPTFVQSACARTTRRTLSRQRCRV